MWAVTPTYDKYGNMLVGLSKQELLTVKNVEAKGNGRQRVTPANLRTMSHKAVKTLVRGGLPDEQRIALWMELSGAAEMKKTHSPTYVETLMQRYLSPRMVHDAEMCVSKWMPGQKMLMSKTGLQTVAQIVQAYCKHTESKAEDSLYVLAAFLVSLMNGQEEAESCFWILTAFLRKIDDQDESGLRGCVQSHVLSALAQKRLPKLCTHLDLISFSLSRETNHWFSHAFVGTLPALTVVRIWDVAMYEGPKIFYRVALALLKRTEVQSLSWVSSMSWRLSRTFDADLLMKAAFRGLGSFPSSEIRQVQSVCTTQSRATLTNHSRRLQALLCPADRSLQNSSSESIESIEQSP